MSMFARAVVLALCMAPLSYAYPSVQSQVNQQGDGTLSGPGSAQWDVDSGSWAHDHFDFGMLQLYCRKLRDARAEKLTGSITWSAGADHPWPSGNPSFSFSFPFPSGQSQSWGAWGHHRGSGSMSRDGVWPSKATAQGNHFVPTTSGEAAAPSTPATLQGDSDQGSTQATGDNASTLPSGANALAVGHVVAIICLSMNAVWVLKF